MRSSSGLQGTEATSSGEGGTTEVSTRVVVAIADARGVDPVEMGTRLHDWIDPDALDALVDSLDDGHVAFDLADHHVHVEANGEVFVDRTP